MRAIWLEIVLIDSVELIGVMVLLEEPRLVVRLLDVLEEEMKSTASMR